MWRPALAGSLSRYNDGVHWTAEHIARVVDAGKSETVFLKERLPVLTVYWTVSVGVSGEVRFARDVCGRDAAVPRALGATCPEPCRTPPVPSVGR